MSREQDANEWEGEEDAMDLGYGDEEYEYENDEEEGDFRPSGILSRLESAMEDCQSDFFLDGTMGIPEGVDFTCVGASFAKLKFISTGSMHEYCIRVDQGDASRIAQVEVGTNMAKTMTDALEYERLLAFYLPSLLECTSIEELETSIQQRAAHLYQTNPILNEWLRSPVNGQEKKECATVLLATAQSLYQVRNAGLRMVKAILFLFWHRGTFCPNCGLQGRSKHRSRGKLYHVLIHSSAFFVA